MVENYPSPFQSPSLERCSSVAIHPHGRCPQPARSPHPLRGLRSAGSPLGRGRCGALRARGGACTQVRRARASPAPRGTPASRLPALVTWWFPLSAPPVWAGEPLPDVPSPQRQGLLLAVQFAHGGGVPGAPRGLPSPAPAPASGARGLPPRRPFPVSPRWVPWPRALEVAVGVRQWGHLPFKPCPAFALRQAPPSSSPPPPGARLARAWTRHSVATPTRPRSCPGLAPSLPALLAASPSHSCYFF